MDLRTTADWVVRPRLLKMPGVAEVIVMGGDRKQYQVLVDPDSCRSTTSRCSRSRRRSRRTTSTPAAGSWRRARPSGRSG